MNTEAQPTQAGYAARPCCVTLGAKMKSKRSIATLLFAVAICGCVTTEQRWPTLLPHQKGHQESGIAFPATIGEFPRGEITQYDAVGQNVSAGYDLIDSQNPVAITVYVSLGPKLLSIGSPPDVIATARKHLTDGYFDEVKRQILKYHPNASAVSDAESSMMFRGQSLYGRIATYKSKELFAHRIQPIVSSAEVYAYGKWIIKFRATYPEATEKAGAESTRAFIKEFMQQNEKAPNQVREDTAHKLADPQH